MILNRLQRIVHDICLNQPHVVSGMIVFHQITAGLLAIAGMLLAHKLAFYNATATSIVSFFTWVLVVLSAVGFAYCVYMLRLLHKIK